ncbi:NADP-dependent oxidoreductase domain-containing protein [Butyriboletus roseoflavus]|nr:NADP-dependent oxidoreductase domain-containing protein [Butyriboletus roseoflavus]
MATPRIHLVYGSGSFSTAPPSPANSGARCNTTQDAQTIIDAYAGFHAPECPLVIDTARGYGAGTSEQMLGQIDIKRCRIDTKIFPNAESPATLNALRARLQESVVAIAPHKIRTLYLHAPDRSGTPIEETLVAIDTLYKEGHFEEFGLSNFNAWEVAEIATLSSERGWLKPTVYQGVYNALERGVELELFPCLHKFGMRFYAYSPLASGLLTNRFLSAKDMDEPGGRFDASVSWVAGMLRTKYEPLLPTVLKLKEGFDAHGISLPNAALRWLQHHSGLRPEHGDAVIIGASNVPQLQANLRDSADGPLPESAVKLFEDAWATNKGVVTHYAF